MRSIGPSPLTSHLKTFVLLALLPVWLGAVPVQIETVEKRPFGKVLEVNAKIVQLSDQKQAVVSRLGGHLERYFVSPGATVRAGQKVALVRSLELSKMTATWLALHKEEAAAKNQLTATKTLYEKGLASRSDYNDARIRLARIESRMRSLGTQLDALGIDPKQLEKPTEELVIRAHAPGRVEALLVNLHTNVDPSTPLVSLVQSSGYYAVAYLPVSRALSLENGIRAEVTVGGTRYRCRFLQLLPRVDEETQRAKALFRIESGPAPLLLDYYTAMTVELPPKRRRSAVRASALTMFGGEWVVFVPVEAHETEAHAANEDEAHEAEAEHDGHDAHDEHGHDRVPYRPVAVVPGERFGGYVAVEGIASGAAYVADGVWYAKSLLLRSALGGHGH